MNDAIIIKNLSKSYQIFKKEPGLLGSLQSLMRRKYEMVHAVKNISLTIKQGELVGFIGPNGAGKTTTLKMLSGLLYPTSGTAQIMGYTPWKRDREFLKQFSLVMGQKAQLWWDLPLYDSLLLQRDIYEMKKDDFQKSLDELTELLDLTSFLKIQVRKLSLGQRMRGELAAALLYRPQVLLLDEPTIGLDVVAQKKIRTFIADYQKKYNATIILTSHNLDDVRQLCDRLIMIDHGEIKFDGLTEDLIKKYVDHKQIVLSFSKPVPREALEAHGRVVEYDPLRVSLQVPREETIAKASLLLTTFPVEDIGITEPSLEDVVRELFIGKDYA